MIPAYSGKLQRFLVKPLLTGFTAEVIHLSFVLGFIRNHLTLSPHCMLALLRPLKSEQIWSFYSTRLTFSDWHDGHRGSTPMPLNLCPQSRQLYSLGKKDSGSPISGGPPTAHMMLSPPIYIYINTLAMRLLFCTFDVPRITFGAKWYNSQSFEANAAIKALVVLGENRLFVANMNKAKTRPWTHCLHASFVVLSLKIIRYISWKKSFSGTEAGVLSLCT